VADKKQTMSLSPGRRLRLYGKLVEAQVMKGAVPERWFRAPASATAVVPEPEDSGPVFDFYEILPDYEVVVPGPSAPANGAARAPQQLAAGTYYLQAGSFRQFEDADRRKASLALLGLSSDIRKVTVNERDHYRVQIGPVSDPAELGRMQSLLSGAGIEYLALRAKAPGQ